MRDVAGRRSAADVPAGVGADGGAAAGVGNEPSERRTGTGAGGERAGRPRLGLVRDVVPLRPLRPLRPLPGSAGLDPVVGEDGAAAEHEVPEPKGSRPAAG